MGKMDLWRFPTLFLCGALVVLCVLSLNSLNPVVNGVEHKDIVIGDDTIIILGVLQPKVYGIVQDSGCGNVYVLSKESIPFAPNDDLIYENVLWSLMKVGDAGFILYVQEIEEMEG